MSKLRIVLWIAVAAALCGLGALSVGGFTLLSREAGRSGASLQAGAPLGGAFQLVDAKGAPVSEAVFREKPSVTLFGYTHCPDVCPTGLTEMGNWIEALGPDADKLRFVFVTVDPERDTPDKLDQYLAFFDPSFIGLSGNPETIQNVERDYGIFAARDEFGDSAMGYLMSHTTSYLAIDRDGKLRLVISHGTDPEIVAEDLRHLV